MLELVKEKDKEGWERLNSLCGESMAMADSKFEAKVRNLISKLPWEREPLINVKTEINNDGAVVNSETKKEIKEELKEEFKEEPKDEYEEFKQEYTEEYKEEYKKEYKEEYKEEFKVKIKVEEDDCQKELSDKSFGKAETSESFEEVEYASNGKVASSTEPDISLVSSPRLDLSVVGVTGLDLTIQSCNASSVVLDHENEKGTEYLTKPLRVSRSKLENLNRQQVGKVSQSDVNQRGSWLMEKEGENKVSSKHSKKASQHASHCSPAEEVKIPSRDASKLDRTGSKNAVNLIQSRLKRTTYNRLLNPVKSTRKPVSSSGENYSEPNANKEHNSRLNWSRNGENQGQIHIGGNISALRTKKWKLASRAK